MYSYLRDTTLGFGMLGLHIFKRRGVDPRHIGFSTFLLIPLLMQSLIHYEDRYFLVLLPIYSIITIWPVLFMPSVNNNSFVAPTRTALRSASVALFLIAFLWGSFKTVESTKEFLTSEPVYLIKASKALQDLVHPGERILARKPHLSFLRELQFTLFPEVPSLDDLLNFVRSIDVKYILYSEMEAEYRPQFRFLLNPDNVPAGLIPIYFDKDSHLVIYKVQLNRFESPPSTLSDK